MRRDVTREGCRESINIMIMESTVYLSNMLTSYNIITSSIFNLDDIAIYDYKQNKLQCVKQLKLK